MTLRFRPQPEIKDLHRRVQEGLSHIGEPLSPTAELSLVGLIPIYRLSEWKKKPLSAPRWEKTDRWIGLVTIGEQPVATIHIGGPFDSQSTGVRGKDSAIALHRSFIEASRVAHHTDERFQMRFIVTGPFHIDAVWLRSRRSLFIPTRLGPGPRPEPKTFTTTEFTKVLRQKRSSFVQAKSRTHTKSP